MGLSREESINRYGTEAYTAWDEPGANADALTKGINVLNKQPNPAQLNQTVQANQANQGYKPQKGFSSLQNQYAEAVYNQPDYMEMYKQYSDQEGLTDIKKLITGIDTSVADIEDKIARIEPNINKEIGNYLITEGQRGRMVTAEQEPLRTQYADILRSRSRLSAEAAAKAELVNTLMGYAQNKYTGRLDYLKTLMEINKSNKSGSGGNIGAYLPNGTDTTGGEEKPTIDPILKGVTIDDSGSIQAPKGTTTQQFDKSGNLILGGGMKLNNTKSNSSLNINKTNPVSISTKYNKLLNLSA
jgi:hypothetical protein